MKISSYVSRLYKIPQSCNWDTTKWKMVSNVNFFVILRTDLFCHIMTTLSHCHFQLSQSHLSLINFMIQAHTMWQGMRQWSDKLKTLMWQKTLKLGLFLHMSKKSWSQRMKWKVHNILPIKCNLLWLIFIPLHLFSSLLYQKWHEFQPCMQLNHNLHRLRRAWLDIAYWTDILRGYFVLCIRNQNAICFGFENKRLRVDTCFIVRCRFMATGGLVSEMQGMR